MAALSGIWNHPASAGASPFAQAKSATSANPMASGTNNSNSNSSTDGATISANDFLTLLVTEMQNQDPTADTDPNEYINQLVNVNSLEQLIQINQTLSSAAGTTPTSQSTPAGTTPQSAAAAANHARASASHPASSHAGLNIQVPQAQAAAAANPATAAHAGAHPAVTSGNLSAPAARPSALRVARSLEAPRVTR